MVRIKSGVLLRLVVSLIFVSGAAARQIPPPPKGIPPPPPPGERETTSNYRGNTLPSKLNVEEKSKFPLPPESRLPSSEHARRRPPPPSDGKSRIGSTGQQGPRYSSGTQEGDKRESNTKRQFDPSRSRELLNRYSQSMPDTRETHEKDNIVDRFSSKNDQNTTDQSIRGGLSGSSTPDTRTSNEDSGLRDTNTNFETSTSRDSKKSMPPMDGGEAQRPGTKSSRSTVFNDMKLDNIDSGALQNRGSLRHAAQTNFQVRTNEDSMDRHNDPVSMQPNTHAGGNRPEPPRINSAAGQRQVSRGSMLPNTNWQQPPNRPSNRNYPTQTHRQQQAPPNQQIHNMQQHRRKSYLPQPPTEQPQGSRTQKPAWKSLWQRVERGLGGLANVEDMIADRASKVVGQTREVITKQTVRLPLTQKVQTQQRSEPNQTMQNLGQQTSRSQYQNNQGLGQRDGTPGRSFGSTAPGGSTMNKSGQSGHAPPQHRSQFSRFALPEIKDVEDSDDDKEDGETSHQQSRSGQQPRQSGSVKTEGDLYGRKDSPFLRLQQSYKQGSVRQTTPAQHPHQRTPQQPVQSNRPQPRQAQLGRPKQPQRRSAFAEMNRASAGTAQRLAAARAAPVDGTRKQSFFSKVGGILPSFHLPGIPLFRGSGSQRAYAAETLDVWKQSEDDKKERRSRSAAFQSSVMGNQVSERSPIIDLLQRFDNGRSTSLLSKLDSRQSKSIGSSRASLDFLVVILLLSGIHQLMPFLADFQNIDSLESLFSVSVPKLTASLVDAAGSWAYYAFGAALLTWTTSHQIHNGRIHELSRAIQKTVARNTKFGQFFLRMVAAIPIDERLSDKMSAAADTQLWESVETQRLQTFVFYTLATLVIMTVSVLQPISLSVFNAVLQAISLQHLRSWPVAWAQLGEDLKAIVVPLGERIRGLLVTEMNNIADHPMKIVLQVVLFGSLLAITVLPFVENRRRVQSPPNERDDDDEDVVSTLSSASTISNLGLSSASRLGLLSQSDGLESTLQRLQSALGGSTPSRATGSIGSLESFIRLLGYDVVGAVLLMAPIAVYFFVADPSAATSTTSLVKWDSIVDISTIILFVGLISTRAIKHAVEAANVRPYVESFVQQLSLTYKEASSGKGRRKAQTQMGSSVNPTLGLSVQDLWAAHTTKRAWAIRGASLDCRSGEIVVLLGDDGAGKSRLLTAIAEELLSPTKRSRSTAKARGSISIGGVESSTWDSEQLRRRLGLVLNDVRTIADGADFLSGLTLEEILDPSGSESTDTSQQSLSAAARKAVNNALMITGLSSSFLPGLPSKLSTVVTANEDELMPSALRPNGRLLSPGQWKKLLFARVLAQTMYENDQSNRGKPMLGSVLLLDDVTTHLSESEETGLFQMLRQSGAATVVTSNKWAAGRLADKIVVMKDGSIVESGTHSELLSMGPQQSVYASKWFAMTN